METATSGGEPAYEAASQARSFMHTYESQKDVADELTGQTAKELEEKRVTLIAVIESIGEYVRDEDATIRAKALHYLAGVLEHLSGTFLSRQQLDVICTFLAERIEDGGAVEGLLALQASPRFTKEMTTMTTRAILERLQDLQIRPQKQRHVIIKLVHELLEHHRTAVSALENEFLVGVIDLFSGEKDPRNLMLVFSVIVVVATEWKLNGHVETLFDSVFCYYPITFRPPPNDPHKITAQDLKDRLRRCIAASSQFAQYAFPQLLEKLDSGSPNVKRDVFDTLNACVQSYYPRVVAEHSIKLWEALKYEVFHAQEDDLADGALSVLQNITARLSSGGLAEIHGSNPTKKFLDIINKECLEKLREPQHKQAKSAARILAALGLASHEALDEVIKAVFPSLLSLYQGAETIESRRSLLECFSIILDAAVVVSRTIPRTRMDENPLIKFKDSLVEKFSQALMATSAEEMSFRILSLNCLAKLSNIAGVLQDDEVGLPVQYFNDIILTEDASGRPDLMNKAIDTLLELSESRYRVLLSITIPRLLVELPNEGSMDSEQYQRSMGILARLSTQQELSETIIRRLFGRLDAALINNASAQYTQNLLAAILYALKSRQVAHSTTDSTYVSKIKDIVKQSAEAAKVGSTSPLGNVEVLRALGRLITLILGSSDEASKSTFAQETYTLFTNHFLLDSLSPEVQTSKTLILSSYILAAVNATITSMRYSATRTSIVQDLSALALETKEQSIQHAILQHLCLLVNKFAEPGDLVTARDICKTINLQDTIASDVPSTIKLLMCLSRAQILRMSNARPLLEHLLDLLGSSDYGRLVAGGFELLLSKDEVLTKDNGAKIRLLSGQVVFTQLLAHIQDVFPASSAEIRSRLLVALGGVLRNIDPSLALAHMKELNPLLLQSLTLPDPAVKIAAIDTLAIAIRESPATLEEHLSSIITQLMSVAIDRKSNEATIRLKAMNCLRIIPSMFKEFILLPHTKAVDLGVVKVLDDPRRDVRKAAVDCRTTWLAMEDPDEDD